MNLRDDSDLTDEERLELADITDEELADHSLIFDLMYGELSHREKAAALLRLCDDEAFRARAREDFALEMLLPPPREPTLHGIVEKGLDIAIEDRREADQFVKANRRWRRSREPATPRQQKAWDDFTKRVGMQRSDAATGDYLDEDGNPLPFRLWNNLDWRARWATVLSVVSLLMRLTALAAVVYAIARIGGWAGIPGLP